MIPGVLKKWVAFGSGIGIEIIGPHGEGLGDYLEFEWEQQGETADQINQKFQPMHDAGARLWVTDLHARALGVARLGQYAQRQYPPQLAQHLRRRRRAASARRQSALRLLHRAQRHHAGTGRLHQRGRLPWLPRCFLQLQRRHPLCGDRVSARHRSQ